MQTNLEQIIEGVRTLPLEDLDKLGEVINEERQAKRGKDERLRKEPEDYAKAKKWIEQHREEYLNQWVCLEGDQLIAHGMDGMEVHRKAKESRIGAPFMVRIIDEPKNFVGAWL